MTDKEKFTPGPWTYDGGFTVFSEGDEWPVCDLISDTEIDGEMYILPYKENAALIAAAPAMYTLLNMIQKILPIEGDENARIAFLLTQIRQVLTKARGEK